jgi:hypothetical protein
MRGRNSSADPGPELGAVDAAPSRSSGPKRKIPEVWRQRLQYRKELFHMIFQAALTLATGGLGVPRRFGACGGNCSLWY